MNKTILIILLFSFTAVHAQLQNGRTDSLHNLLGKANNDSLRENIMLRLGDEYASSKADSAFNYYQQAFNLSVKLRNPSLQIEAGTQLAGLYNEMGNYPEALKLSLANLKIEEQIRDTNFIFFTKREIMWAYSNIGDFQKALELLKEMESFANSDFKDLQ